MDMPEKLWDLANLVTGFAVVQSLALTYALVKDEVKAVRDSVSHWTAAIGTCIFNFFYMVAAAYCGSEGRKLDVKSDPRTWSLVTCGREIAIVSFALVTLGTIYVHWRDASKGP